MPDNSNDNSAAVNDLGLEEEEEEDYRLVERGEKVESIWFNDMAAVLAAAELETCFIFQNAVPAGLITMLAGAPGSNKSWIVYDALRAMLRGEPWLNIPVVTDDEPRRGLVLNFDNPAAEFARRMKRMGFRGDDAVRVHSVGMSNVAIDGDIPMLLQLPAAFEQLMAMIAWWRPHMIVVDSLRQAHTGDESNSLHMGRVMACLRAFTHYGAAVVVIHHSGKPQQGPQGDSVLDDIHLARGSSEIIAALDTLIVMDGTMLRWAKTRGWRATDEDGRPMPALEVGAAVVDDGDTTRVIAVDPASDLVRLLTSDGDMTRVEIAKALALKEIDVGILISKLENANRIKLVRGKANMGPRKYRAL